MPKSISSVLRSFLGLPAAQPSPERIAAATRQRRGCVACNWTGYADFAAVPCEACGSRRLGPVPQRGPVSAAIAAGRGEAPEGIEMTDGPGIDLSGTHAKMQPILDMIERQEAAEKVLLSAGCNWTGTEWSGPASGDNTLAAIAYALDYAKANGRFKAMTWLESWHAGDTETRDELAAAVDAGEISY